MPWTRFSLAGAAGATLDADAVRYGPGLPTEDELKLLGHVEGRRVLELACGAGASAVALAKAGARVIAVDGEARNLDDTRDRAEREGVRVETHQGPLAELAFVRADTIDAALSTYGLATVGDLDRVFRQVHRVLRTDRPFVFSLPHPAFVMLDPAGGEPVLRRAWWDTSPVTWSTGVRRRARPGHHARHALLGAGSGRVRGRHRARATGRPRQRRRRVVRHHALGAPHPRRAGAQARDLTPTDLFRCSRVTNRASPGPSR